MKESAVQSRTSSLLYLDWQTIFRLRQAWIDRHDIVQVSELSHPSSHNEAKQSAPITVTDILTMIAVLT